MRFYSAIIFASASVLAISREEYDLLPYCDEVSSGSPTSVIESPTAAVENAIATDAPSETTTTADPAVEYSSSTEAALPAEGTVVASAFETRGNFIVAALSAVALVAAI